MPLVTSMSPTFLSLNPSRLFLFTPSIIPYSQVFSMAATTNDVLHQMPTDGEPHCPVVPAWLIPGTGVLQTDPW